MIENPILCGFNPDPSILRVKDDYYIATSTFEWLPGIQIHHSKDLSHWRLLTHALTRETQINLQGIAPSKGVWAPCLTFKDNQYWLAYSLVRCITDNFFDLDNFLITAPEITGPWSDPIYLNSSGFDPSLFHDEDGRKWLVNLEWDFRMGYEHPGALVLQEYDSQNHTLIGKAKQIYRGGSELGCLEGPHLFHHGNWYYLMAAEGGTGYGHGVTMARAHALEGPWEKDPHNPILTSAAHSFNARGNPQYLKPEYYNPDSYLQKSGHGSLVETPNGEAYIAHLCARPLMPELRCMLGRETSLQKAYWTQDEWLSLGKSNLAQKLVPEPELQAHPWPKEPEVDNFDAPVLNENWAAPRRFIDNSWADLKARPGYLRLTGGESLFSTFKQSLVARRMQHFNFSAAASIDFNPRSFQEMAGLVCLYDTMNFYYLRLYWSQTLDSKALGIFTSDNGKRSELSGARVKIDHSGPIYLKVQVSDKKLQFAWSIDEKIWQPIGPAFDASKLSDEYCHTGEFTGAFVGICVQDLGHRKAYADFDWFSYSPE